MAVEGIGGVFFRSQNPEALAAWYRKHLNIGGGCVAAGAGVPNPWCWMANGGPVVFAPFSADTDYFSSDKAFMLNLRVSGLGAMIEQLRAAGIEVTTRDEWDQAGVGRFARIHDPEGNPIELWEPAAE